MLKILSKILKIVNYLTLFLGWSLLFALVLILVFEQGTIGTKSSCYGNQQQCKVEREIKQCNN